MQRPLLAGESMTAKRDSQSVPPRMGLDGEIKAAWPKHFVLRVQFNSRIRSIVDRSG